MYTFETNLLRGLILTVLIGMLVACGGGGGSAQTSESIVAKGVITQMGSIWVNGVEYETPEGGSYSDDDTTSTTASYEVGQVVSLRGRRNDDGVSGTADVVESEAEIEGEAEADNIINGVKIITDQTLTPGTRYEVHGFRINDTTIQATFIKVDDDGDLIDEVKGVVNAVDLTSITVNNVVYLLNDASLSFAVNDIVEVHFDPTTNPLTATTVEHEDSLFDDLPEGQEVEFEGAVNLDTTGCPTGADFRIVSTCIDWDSVREWSDGLTGSIDMISGIRVEAEGHFVGDLLVAEKIKGRGNEVRISSFASNVDGTGGPGTLDVFGGAIQVTYEAGLTEIDVSGGLINNSEVEIRGIRTGATSVLALRIKDDSVDLSRQELRAEIDENGADSGSGTITLMGITSLADSSTQLEIEDVLFTGGLASFLASIDDDNIVSPTNGPRDVVEVRIDASSGDGSSGSPYFAKQIEIELEDD